MTYRTGRHWGVTIVREAPQPVDGTIDLSRDQLVAVVVNGDQVLAERICALLNGDLLNGDPAAEEAWERLEECPSIDREGIWRCEREAGHDEPHSALRWYQTWRDDPAAPGARTPPSDSCTCVYRPSGGADSNCVVHQGRRAKGPKPPNPPGCICDGSGRTCPRHGAVI